MALVAWTVGFGRTAQAAEPPRRAVVISSSAYTSLPPLLGCEPSARVVANALRRAGFEVTQLSNPTNGRLGAALQALGDQTASVETRAVAYVCGYTAVLRGRLFLLPAQASIIQETDLLAQGIVGRVAFGSVAGAGTGLLLIDGPPQPGTEPLPFAALERTGDSPGAGYAVSRSVLDGSGAGLLATGLNEALAGQPLALETFLSSLTAKQGRPALLTVVRPSGTAWLVGEPPPQVAAALPPAAEVPTPQVAPSESVPAATAEAAPAAAPPPDEPAVLSTSEIVLIQAELKRIGYYRGLADGRIGPETIVAIRLLQRELGAEVTGRLSKRQVDRLLRR